MLHAYPTNTIKNILILQYDQKSCDLCSRMHVALNLVRHEAISAAPTSPVEVVAPLSCSWYN